MTEGRFRVSLGQLDEETTTRKVMASFRCLSGKEGLRSFLDLANYQAHAAIYSSFEQTVNGFLENSARRYLLGLPLPRGVERYLRELLEPVITFKPNTLGLSLQFSQQLYFALTIAKMLKGEGTPVVMGGATLSVMGAPERLLRGEVTTLLDGKPHRLELQHLVDYVLPGEGEVGLATLLEFAGGQLSRVPGLIYGSNGRVVRNEAQVVGDLDRLPVPDFADLTLEGYHSPVPILPYRSSRGCPWRRCSFCTHHKTYHGYREESVEATAARIAALQARYGVRTFSLVDEMIQPRRFRALSKAMVERGLEVSYAAYARPVRGFGASLLEEIHRSGARVIMWGVESGSQRVLDAMGKGTRVDDVARVLRQASKVGIWNLAFLIYGFPGETEAEWRDTLGFVEGNREHLDAISGAPFVLLSGSEIYRRPERFGVSAVRERPGRDLMSVGYDYDIQQGVSTEGLRRPGHKALQELHRYGRCRYFPLFRDHMLVYAAFHGKGDAAC
jgi:anaerobic magnesium-protoporphyrin IX monomethyl ester cyclase